MSDEVKFLDIDFILAETSIILRETEHNFVKEMLKNSPEANEALKEAFKHYKSKYDVFDDIKRETFEKIATDEKKMLCTSKGINVTSSALEDGTYPKCEIAAVITWDDLTNDPAPDFKLPELTDQALECKNDKCRCKVRLKENEALKRE